MTIKILNGDCLGVLPTLESGSVHTCVTSPPYFGLRDYGHDGQVGLESTPDEYVAKLVAVFREVRRVLRDDGTLWLNLGDSYAGGGRGGNPPDSPHQKQKTNHGSVGSMQHRKMEVPDGLKSKDLIGIPWRVAFALQADGWWLRQDIIWHKPNPMPESVRDRCTKAHEYVFLFSKSPRYYFDHEAIKEPVSNNPVTQARNNRSDKGFVGAKNLYGTGFGQSGAGSYDRKQQRDALCGCVDEIDDDHYGPITAMRGCPICGGTGLIQTRNRRSVWTVSTKPYKGAHFATFPPDLIEPCILAGAPEGGTVLDPFGGSGTTGMVAERHGRNAVLIELNPDYIALAEGRVR